MRTWREIAKRLRVLSEQSGGIVAQAEREQRDLTPAEEAQIDRNFAEFDTLMPEKPNPSYYAKLRLQIALAGAH